MLNLDKYGDLIPAQEPSVSLTVGRNLSIDNRVYTDAGDDNEEITEALQMLSSADLEWLKSELERSASAENTVAAEIAESFGRWNHQARISRLLQDAIAIAEAEGPAHSANKWDMRTRHGDEIYTISNAVYDMTIEIIEDQKYVRNSSISVPRWTISWNLGINGSPSASRRSNNYQGSHAVITGNSKAFTDKERADKYFEAIKVQYSHYFKEETPPVPLKYAKYFTVNGVLIPGYSLEEREACADAAEVA